MNVIEKALKTVIRSPIKIQYMQFSFMPVHGTIDAVSILRQNST